MWDTAGTLPNLWAASLHTVLSRAAQSLDKGLPEPPCGDDELSYLEFTLKINPELDLALVWTEPSSAESLNQFAQCEGDRVTLIQR